MVYILSQYNIIATYVLSWPDARKRVVTRVHKFTENSGVVFFRKIILCYVKCLRKNATSITFLDIRTFRSIRIYVTYPLLMVFGYE